MYKKFKLPAILLPTDEFRELEGTVGEWRKIHKGWVTNIWMLCPSGRGLTDRFEFRRFQPKANHRIPYVQ